MLKACDCHSLLTSSYSDMFCIASCIQPCASSGTFFIWRFLIFKLPTLSLEFLMCIFFVCLFLFNHVRQFHILRTQNYSQVLLKGKSLFFKKNKKFSKKKKKKTKKKKKKKKGESPNYRGYTYLCPVVRYQY